MFFGVILLLGVVVFLVWQGVCLCKDIKARKENVKNKENKEKEHKQ